MCYVVVKNKQKHGCYALKAQHNRKLVDLKRNLEKIVSDDAQVVLISRPSAYGEYSPYQFAESEGELLKMAKNV